MSTTLELYSTTIPATASVPLTTTFYPGSNCFTETRQVDWVNGVNIFTMMDMEPDSTISRAGWFSLGPLDWSSCFPPGYHTQTGDFFSPGICPSGFAIASSTLLTADLTQATCCPSGYQWNSHIQFDWETTQPCYFPAPSTDYVITVTGLDGAATTATGFDGAVNARAVFIKWGSSDFLPPTSSSTPIPPPTTTSTPINRAGLPAPDHGSRVSSKAWIAGPVIGSFLGCAVIALVVLWYIRQEGSQRLSKATSNILRLPTETTHVELPAKCAPQELGMENHSHELP